jgi:4'-phosphopantetheinyl transferase
MMPAESEIDVVVMRVSQDEEAAAAAVAVLSPDERRRANRYIMPCDRRRFIGRRAQLRTLLGKRLGLAAASVRLSSTTYGKPVLAAPLDTSGIAFSLSHAGDLTVYAFASNMSVGVDVESIRMIDNADRVARIAFSPREYATYERLPVGDKPMAFLNCWTRKEAFVKATGTGLAHSHASFDVSLVPGEPARLLRLGSTDGDSGWRMHSFLAAPGFIAAVAARGAE